MKESLAKWKRWYHGGPELAQAMRQHYGTLVEAAIAGEPASCRSSVGRRRALLIMLDQFIRNI